MENILSGLALFNGIDIWTEYGVFLCEDKQGDRKNQNALMRPSKLKSETAVNIREESGEKYSTVLNPRNEPRDLSLQFALYNSTQAGWISKYVAFINFLKQGKDGWLDMEFPQLGLTLHVRYTDCDSFDSWTPLWVPGLGVYANKFTIKFREPVPII